MGKMVVINKIEHDEEDGLAWKVETLEDKEVKKKRKETKAQRRFY